METCSAVLTFESVDEILWWDHSDETSPAVLLHGTICFSTFYTIKFEIFLEFGCLALLEFKGLSSFMLPGEPKRFVPLLFPSASIVSSEGVGVELDGGANINGCE